MFAADGAHSKVREALGVTLEGSSFPEIWPLYDVELDDPLNSESAHVSFVEGGMVFLLCIEPGVWRVFANVPEPLARMPRGTKVGEGFTGNRPFMSVTAFAAREAFGRVVLAGDAAHLHAPVAARGINLGIEDAFVFAHCATDALHGDLQRLTEYGLLRHDVHAGVVAGVDRLTRLARGQPAILGLLRRFVMPGCGFRLINLKGRRWRAFTPTCNGKLCLGHCFVHYAVFNLSKLHTLSRPQCYKLQRNPQFAHVAGGFSDRSARRNARYAGPLQISRKLCWVASPSV